jgi:DNA-binding response OmpR family regulator
MDASIDHDSPFILNNPGRFTRVSVQTAAGEIEARLSEQGNWELRVRRDEEMSWRLACTGDLDCGAVTHQPVLSVAEETIMRGPLTIEPSSRRASVGKVDVELSRKEFALLLILASHPDRVYTKAELLKAVWGHDGSARTRTLDCHASRLRRKLRAAGAEPLVINVWGVGYRLWDGIGPSISPALGAISATA